MVETDTLQEREGSDITAADMILPHEEPSQIVEFFANATVFLTGATGYLGKMTLEKLIRSTEIKRIYILIRPKKGKDPQKRLEEIFSTDPAFEPLRRKNTNFMAKVTMMEGDCAFPEMGLSDGDKEKIINEVDCIIHCAATVRFDEKLRTATNINVRSVKDLLGIAGQMKHLRAFIYISTAFSNCVRKKIDEAFYEPPITGDKLMSLCDALDDQKLDAITKTVIEDYPNTYVFTKAVAENIIKEYGKNLPVAVFRPAIVISSVKEPVAGYIDNFYGATGVVVGAALGVLRCLHCRKENIAEMVPADFVVNCCLASAWDVASIKTLNDNKETKEQQTIREEQFEREIPIYNFVSSPESIIRWEHVYKWTKHYAPQVASPLLVWHCIFAMRTNYYHHLLAQFFFETVPAYIVDFILICIGKKPMLVKGYRKISKFAAVISYFAIREWKFSNKNVQALWKQMNKQDRDLFEFSMKGFDWELFWVTFIKGGRIYLLKDPMETLPQGKVRYYKLMVAHYTLVTVLVLGLLKLALMLYSLIF